MNKPNIFYLILISVFSCNLSVLAQKDSSLLINAVNVAQNQPVSERVYLHFDKPTYFLGDTVWYKAYVVIGQKHQLSALSHVLHVELIGPNDSVYKRENLALQAGVAWGDFSLSRKLKPGNYYIRAYTNWMRNEGIETFFEQKLNIPSLTSSLDLNDASNKIKVQFFPEGGELVNDLRSKIVVKAAYSTGLSDTVKGTIIDNENSEVAYFKTNDLGLGVFALTPQDGKSYKAKIILPTGDSIISNLPVAKQSGLVLSINNNRADSVLVKVALNSALFKEKQQSKFYLVAQQGGKVLFTTTGQIEAPVFVSSIEKSRFPSGLVQFTLFAENGEPLNNRVAYIQNSDTLKFSIKPDAKEFKTRQKVKFDITTTNANNLPVQGAFSVSVINESRTGFDEKNEDHIVSTFLLSADLKGKVEKPAYYFSNNQNQTKADLDLMLLTHDYNRFNWKKVLDSIAMPLNFKPEKGLELSGNIQTPGGKPVPNSKVTLIANKENYLTDTTADLNGDFTFKNLNLSDTNKVVINAHKHNNGKNVTIFVKKPDYPLVLKHTQTTNSSSTPIKGLEKNEQSNANGITFTIKGSLLSKYPDLTTALKTTLPEISFNNGRFINARPSGKEMALVIDGKQKTTADLNVYKVDEIDMVNILEGAINQNKYAVSGNYDNRLIAITTKKYAGSDTVTTLKQVNIVAKKVHKPDIYNGYGARYEYLADMKRVNQSLTLEDALRSAIPGLFYLDNKYYYELHKDDHIVKVLINNFPAELDEIKLYSPNEIDNIRMIGQIDKNNPPTLIITTKHFAGTDTLAVTNLKEVSIKAQKINKAPVITHSANLNGAGNANQVIMGDKLTSCVNLSDCLIGRINGVIFNNGIPINTRSGPMMVIIDGQILDGTHLNDLNTEDIYSIEVLRSGAYAAIYGSNAPSGALVITTRRGGENSYLTSSSPSGIITYPFIGYYNAKAFPSIKFSNSKSSTQKPELKNTIFWQPNLVTDKDGKASFEFYNNDTKGTYRIVIEGIDDEGNLGRFVYKYKVE